MTYTELSEIMDELGLSQTDAARLLSVDPRTFRRWISDTQEISGPGAQALRAWRRLNALGLPWSPDSLDLAEAEPDQIAAHRSHAIGLADLLLKVQSRGGASGAWEVDLKKKKATLGPIEVSFYRLSNGGFSPQSYTRRDNTPPDIQRDWVLIEDAFACIAAKLSELRTYAE